jgi:hypothetical protein
MADKDRATSPTPEERKKLDAEAKKKEDEEQSQLPYKWTQTIKDVDVTAPIPANIKGRDLDVKLTKTGVRAGIKGQDVIIEVQTNLLRLAALQKANRNAGNLPAPHRPRRVNMDARDHQLWQGTRHPPRQVQQDGMVGARRHVGTQDRHLQDHARE